MYHNIIIISTGISFPSPELQPKMTEFAAVSSLFCCEVDQYNYVFVFVSDSTIQLTVA